jgi:hypothetical protein
MEMTNSTVVEALIATLREPEDRGLTASSDRLVRLHQEASKTDVLCFMYEGVSFRHSTAPKGKLAYPVLHKSLYHEADAHLAREKKLVNDLQAIRQAIHFLVRSCLDKQDLRDVLPECLVHLCGTGLTQLPRNREAAWNLDPNSRPYRTYLKILPKIEFFAAARLMY